LLNGTQYEFMVRAVNGVGAGASATATATPQPTGIRLPLTAAGGDGQVTLRWTAPANRASVHEYQVRQRISVAGHGWPGWSTVSGGSTARDTTITGLTNGVSYQFEAQAVDGQGTSVARSNVASATPAGRPGMPALTASEGDGQVALNWTAADANGSAITRYEMQSRVAASGHGWPGWSAVSGGSAARDTTITGLTNDTEYEFAVRAVNGVGTGAAAAQKATPQAAATTIAVSFGAAAYQATEGGEAVAVSVGLSPSPLQTVRIPVMVSADAGTEAGDYTVAGLSGGTVWLSFAADASSQSFAMTANEDADIDDETVSLSFGTLPVGVVAGTPRQATVTLRDEDADTVPVFSPSGTARDALVGRYFSFTRPAASGGNGALTYSVRGSCAGLTVTATSVSGQPSKAGQCGITWTVRDTDGDSDTYSLQIAVAADTAPSFASSGTTRSAIVGQYFSFTRPAASGGNGSLRYSVSGSCAGLTVTASSASGSPSSSGSCVIKWTVRDSDGDSDTYSLQIAVAADTAPAFASSGTTRSATVGSYFSFTRPAASGGNGSLRYSVSGSCAGLTVTASSASGAPSSSGQCGITWTVRDSDGDTDTYSLQLNVRNRRT
ncbi:MAG: fibronectin type III domain-containing protein, partial [Gemmatimonadetes bacterium]|nr:fibronectin type III domain-containing protein [Gemmatimonadota bacterium]